MKIIESFISLRECKQIRIERFLSNRYEKISWCEKLKHSRRKILETENVNIGHWKTARVQSFWCLVNFSVQFLWYQKKWKKLFLFKSIAGGNIDDWLHDWSWRSTLGQRSRRFEDRTGSKESAERIPWQFSVLFPCSQIIHIDYNICFEKGKKLRVPEKVPYRLTQNLRSALGVGGLDGVFLLSSENVLKILRQGKEILLNLLESFIYDPLIDWTGHDTGVLAAFYGGQNNFYNQLIKKKRQAEKEALLKMFQHRIVEIRPRWTQLGFDSF